MGGKGELIFRARTLILIVPRLPNWHSESDLGVPGDSGHRRLTASMVQRI